MSNQNNSTFSLYIHWPFCLKKCPYCDFNSYATKYEENEWIDALLIELDLHSTIFKNFKLTTIFFGGGTPSLISPDNIKLILEKIHSIWPYQNIEISIEINPSSVETHDLEKFLKNGINRLSVGVQSLNDKDLKFLGRIHTAQEAIQIVTQAAKICPKVSCDFIYALPHDTLASWQINLNQIINFLTQNHITHSSLYQLTIEEKTNFFTAVKNKLWQPMDDDLQSTLYTHTHKIMTQNHWDHYEISNFAKDNSSKSQHNLRYWKYENYLGIGPGAHSRMFLNNKKVRFNNILSPKKWKDTISSQQSFPFNFIEQFQEISTKEQVEEKLFMGLRLKEGIEIKPEDFTHIDQENFQYLLNKKILHHKNNQYKLSLSGQLKLNAVLKLLFI